MGGLAHGRMSRDERLAQAEKCLASSMTVKDWCAANGVPAATMYVWVRRPEAEGRLSEERAAELRPMARKSIDASLELADELESA